MTKIFVIIGIIAIVGAAGYVVLHKSQSEGSQSPACTKEQPCDDPGKEAKPTGEQPMTDKPVESTQPTQAAKPAFKIKIEYCTAWGYKPKAGSLSEAIQKQYKGIEVNLVKSSGGAFEVYKDDKLIFSKKKEERFPTHEEILKAIAQ